MSAEYAWSMKTAMNKYLASFFFVWLGVLVLLCVDAGPADVSREVTVDVAYEHNDYRVTISASGESVTVEKFGAGVSAANSLAASAEAQIGLGPIQEFADGIPKKGSVEGSAETVICIDAIAT